MNQPALEQADFDSEETGTTEQTGRVSKHVQRVEMRASVSWSGPLPHPMTLQQYDVVAPGSAERILSVFESQMKHRMDVEARTLDSESNRSYLGLAAGFILSVMIVLGGFYVMINVHPWAGAGVIGTQIAVIAGVFVYGTRSRRDERERKSERTRRILDHDNPDDEPDTPLDGEEED